MPGVVHPPTVKQQGDTVMGQRAQQRRQRAWAGFRADMADQFRTEGRLSLAEDRDRKAALESGEIDNWTGMSEWAHLAIVFLTAGLWLPVYIYVLIRNRRRYRSTSVGSNDKVRRRIERRALKQRRKDRARATRSAGRAA